MENEELRRVGLKVTLPRLKILHILEEAVQTQQHMSAEEVYRKLITAGDDVGLATVYRVLTQFESAGLVIRHNFEGGHAIYELAAGDHHDHLVCVRCSKIIEFVDEIIEQRQKEISIESGFKMTDHSLIIYGVCSSCEGQQG